LRVIDCLRGYGVRGSLRGQGWSWGLGVALGVRGSPWVASRICRWSLGVAFRGHKWPHGGDGWLWRVAGGLGCHGLSWGSKVALGVSGGLGGSGLVSGDHGCPRGSQMASGGDGWAWGSQDFFITSASFIGNQNLRNWSEITITRSSALQIILLGIGSRRG
jgi:hypothetical protein